MDKPLFSPPARGPASRQTRAGRTESRVVELRQYTLRPGARDAMIELFDREFLESQERLGARVIAQFRDLERPDRFVWLRGFADMETRKRALTAFYGGPLWQAHREAANATMVDSDNVLLLRPAREGAGFGNEDAPRPAPGATAIPETVVTATLWSFHQPMSAAAILRFEREGAPLLERCGAGVAAFFVTESAPNNYPRLPVREGEHAFVWISVFPKKDAQTNAVRRLGACLEWNGLLDDFAGAFKRPPEHLCLSPTARSRPLV